MAKRGYLTSEVRGNVRGQGQRLRVPGCDGAGTAERSYPASKVRGSGREELPHTPKPDGRVGGREELLHAPPPEARGSGREEQPHVQGAVAVQAQERLEELSHVEGRRAAVRRYPSSKVRSNGWALLEQP